MKFSEHKVQLMKDPEFKKEYNNLNKVYDKIQKNIMKQIHSFNKLNMSHIPYIDDNEQKEIEEILKNEDCHVIISNTTYELKTGELIDSQQIKKK